MLSRQKIFDNAVKRLAKQGGPSYNEKKGQCEYRDPRGRACVIGASIPDERYDLKFESRGVGLLRDLEDILPIEAEHDFLFVFQGLHDDELALFGLDAVAARKHLRTFARATGLDFSKVKLIKQWSR